MRFHRRYQAEDLGGGVGSERGEMGVLRKRVDH
jgi:hypothetical protein